MKVSLQPIQAGEAVPLSDGGRVVQGYDPRKDSSVAGYGTVEDFSSWLQKRTEHPLDRSPNVVAHGDAGEEVVGDVKGGLGHFVRNADHLAAVGTIDASPRPSVLLGGIEPLPAKSQAIDDLARLYERGRRRIARLLGHRTLP